MTILDKPAIHNLAKAKANLEYTKVEIWRRRNGEYMLCTIGSLSLIKAYLPEGEQISYIGFEIPDDWEHKADEV